MPGQTQPNAVMLVVGQTAGGAFVPMLVDAQGVQQSRLLLAPNGKNYALTTTASSQNQTLQTGIKGISVYSRGSDAYISLGTNGQSADATKIFIAAGERLDLDTSSMAAPNIAHIFGPSGVTTTLQVMELV